jgi:hypothetical protein
MARRTAQQQIDSLQAKIRSIQERAERKAVRSNPAIKHMSAALRSVNKAMQAGNDPVLRKALDEARETLTACLTLVGVKAKATKGSSSTLAPRGRGRSAGRPEADDLLRLVKSKPGSNSEQLSAALESDAASMRPVIHELIAAGRLRTEGQRRGTRYFPA